MKALNHKAISGCMTSILVYEDFEPVLISKWNELYNNGANFNLSFEWCSIWFKYFNKNKKLHIITIWENKELKLLAPFYKEKDKLYLIGSKWDYINEGNILYIDEKYIENLLNYLIQEKFDVYFKYLNSELLVSNLIVKKYVQNAVKYVYQIKNAKPYLEISPGFKYEIRSEIKKCKHSAIKLFGEELGFDFITEKREDLFNEFISIHKKRWNGGIFKTEHNLESFFKEIYLNTNLAFLSRLYFAKSNKTVAYSFNYFDSNNTLWYYQPANNLEYKEISPGKILIEELIKNACDSGIKRIDFGLGTARYKYRYINKDCIMFDFETFNNNKFGFKIKRLADKLVGKIILSSSSL